MKKFIAGFVSGALLFGVVGAGAAGIWDNISVLKNDIKVVVNGNEVTADNFLYNDTTYLPLRAVSMALGEVVEYDEATNTAYIGERIDNVGVKSKYTPSEELIKYGNNIKIKDGIYYINCDTIEEISILPFQRKFSFGLDKANGEVVLYTGVNRGADGEEIGRWTTTEFDGWVYVPYDTYVDEVEPLLK